MKKLSLVAILGAVALLVAWAISAYNGLVSEDENVSQVWANVETAYQRRADLIPNLVATVKGYAEHEKGTFEAVVEARAKATSINLTTDDLSEENLKKFQEAQSHISSALGRLIAVSENYPELKASEQFIELQAQLEGTENRISEARKKYNEAVKTYNLQVRQFPGSIFASLFGFRARTPFAAEAGAEKAPTVQF